jgi:hypothetical protein
MLMLIKRSKEGVIDNGTTTSASALIFSDVYIQCLKDASEDIVMSSTSPTESIRQGGLM